MVEYDPKLHVYGDSASAFVEERMGVSIPESKIYPITRSLNLEVFTIGTRKAFRRSDFVTKFDEYVTQSAKDTRIKTGNRVSGALLYNEKVDVLFYYVYYLYEKGLFDFEQCYHFMTLFDKGKFKDVSSDKLKQFIHSRRERKDSANSKKAQNASKALDKALSLRSNESKGQKKDKQSYKIKSINEKDQSTPADLSEQKDVTE